MQQENKALFCVNCIYISRFSYMVREGVVLQRNLLSAFAKTAIGQTSIFGFNITQVFCAFLIQVFGHIHTLIHT